MSGAKDTWFTGLLQIFGESWCELEVPDIARRAHVSLSRSARIQIARNCSDRLMTGKLRLGTQTRIPLCKLLVALSADSDEYLHCVLQDQADRYAYEVHFSLFCHMDGLLAVDGACCADARMVKLAESYLATVPKRTAFAAWMAGDLIGDHLNPPESVRALRDLVSRAKYVAGRLGALHGLEMALRRKDQGKLSHYERENVIAILRRVSEADRSSLVRRRATQLLEEIVLQKPGAPK